MRSNGWLITVLLAASVGLVFAGVSTFDFVRHLDRDVHGVSCSFIPGLGSDHGPSGCATAMMSSYSSVMRTTVWGGVPIALGAMSVFAFLLFYAAEILLGKRASDPRATGFLALATALPALASAVMLYVSLTKLGTTCKLCVAIYIASAACLAGGIGAWRRAARHGEPSTATPRVSFAFLALAFVVGVVMVATPAAVYAGTAPDHRRFIGSCDGLTAADDPNGVLIPLGRARVGAAPTIEVLDPLCPACKAFEDRLDGTGRIDQLDRRVLMFPLDSTCNWMVDEPIHPGACTVSEAVLCAGDRAGEVVAWSFANQEEIRAATAKNPGAAAAMVKQRFPDLASCIGSAKVQARLNQSLRWAVANSLTVLTPQVFINGVRLCNEDLDLGLDYMLDAALVRYKKGTLIPPTPSKPAASQDPPIAMKTTVEDKQAPPPKKVAPAPEPSDSPPAPAPAASEEPKPKDPAPADSTGGAQ